MSNHNQRQTEFHFDDAASISESKITTPSPKGFDIEKAIAEEWRVPLGENVVLWMKTARGSLRGRLELDQIPVDINRTLPLHLRIDGQRILWRDIESWTLAENSG